MSQVEGECRACRTSVRVTESEVRRLLAELVAQTGVRLADDVQSAARWEICRACPDLQYGTTCRHCGCLAAVRARIANKSCPAPVARW